MKQLICINDLPSSLDALELMEVKGGERKDNDPNKTICTVVGLGTIKCPVKGSGECSGESVGIINCNVEGSGLIHKEDLI